MQSWGIVTISALGVPLLDGNHEAQQHVQSRRLRLALSVKGLAKVNTPARRILLDKHYFAFTGQQATSLSTAF